MDIEQISATIVGVEPVEFVVGTGVIPVVVGWNPDGSTMTARELAQRARMRAEDCDHFGAIWSGSLAAACPRCGRDMFLPPALLKWLPDSTLTAMGLLWVAAGWPVWANACWQSRDAELWTLQQHALFDHCGGIPVQRSRLQLFQLMLEELGV